MSEPFIKVDLHDMRREEAIKAIEAALKRADNGTYQIQVIHGYNRGTSLKQMVYEEFQYDDRIKRIKPGDNQGVTLLVLRDL